MLRKTKGFFAVLVALAALAIVPAFAFADEQPALLEAQSSDSVLTATGRIPMFRLYNPNSGEHFYTAAQDEHDNLVSLGWNDEGYGWIAPTDSATAVHRLYNGVGGEHHYTTDLDEASYLVYEVGWSYEGIGWYSDAMERQVLYREYNPNAFSNNHNYTTDKAEHEMLINAGWRDEGTAWFGVEIHHASVKVQGYDAFTMTIDSSYAPITATNFIDLANRGYYNGLAFYRIQDEFCLQGGTKGDTASGSDPSLTPIPGEFSENGYDYNLLANNFQKGTVALARTTDPDSATSTFFVTLSTSTYTSLSLDGQYAAFATIDDAGMQTVDKLCNDYMAYADQSNMGTITDQAHKPIIESVTILD